MSTQQRCEPMGGEGDCSHLFSSNNKFTLSRRTNEDSVPSDGFVDDLTLKVRSLLTNFEEGEESSKDAHITLPSVSYQHSEEIQSPCNQSKNFKHGIPLTSTRITYVYGKRNSDSQGTNTSRSYHDDLKNANKNEDGTNEHCGTNFGLCSRCSVSETISNADEEIGGKIPTDPPKSHSKFFLNIPQTSIKSYSDLPRTSVTEIRQKKCLFNIVSTPFISSNQKEIDDPLSYDNFTRALQQDKRDIEITTNDPSSTEYIKSECRIESSLSPEPVLKSHSTNTDIKKYLFFSRPDIQNSGPLPQDSIYIDLSHKHDTLERETERSWSEILVTAEAYSEPPDSPSSIAVEFDKNKDRLNSYSRQSFLLPPYLNVPQAGPDQRGNSLKYSMAVRRMDMQNESLDEFKSNVPNSEGIFQDLGKGYEFTNFRPASSLSDFEQETPPLSASSIGSSKRLEWDNGADIGYSIANANSKLKRKVPKTARSEPEGISLINETLNVNSGQPSTGFSNFVFSSLTSSKISPMPNFSFTKTAPPDKSSAYNASSEDDQNERNSSPEASISRSDSKKSVIYNSTKDMQSKTMDSSFGSVKNFLHPFKNISCPDLTDLTKNSAGYHNLSKIIPFGNLSKSDEVVSFSKKLLVEPKTTIINTSGFPNVVSLRQALERNLLFSKFNKAAEVREVDHGNKLISFQVNSQTNSVDNLSHSCKSCHQSVLKIKVDDDVQHDESGHEKLFSSRNDNEVSVDLSNDNTQLYNVTQLSQHDAIVDWIDGNAVYDTDLHYITEMPELPAECQLDSLHSRPLLFFSHRNETQVPRNIGNIFTNTTDYPASGNLEVKPHIRWYPFTSTTNMQDIKNVSTQTAMSFIAKQLNESPTQVDSTQQTLSPEEPKHVSQASVDSTKYSEHFNTINQKSSDDYHSDHFSNSSEPSNSPEFHSSSETVLAAGRRIFSHNGNKVESSAKSSSFSLAHSGHKSTISFKHMQQLDHEREEQSKNEMLNSHMQESVAGTLQHKLIPNTLYTYSKEDSVFKPSMSHGGTKKSSLYPSNHLRIDAKDISWLTEAEITRLGSTSNVLCSPDLSTRERKLGVGQCESLLQSHNDEVALNMAAHTSYKDDFSQCHSPLSHPEPVNYPHVEYGLSFDDGGLQSTSSSRSSVAGHSVSPLMDSETVEKLDPIPPVSRYANADNLSQPSTTISGHKRISTMVDNLPKDDNTTSNLHNSEALKHSSQDIVNEANRLILDARQMSAAIKRSTIPEIYTQQRSLLLPKHVTDREKIPQSHSDPILSARNVKYKPYTRESSTQISTDSESYKKLYSKITRGFQSESNLHERSTCNESTNNFLKSAEQHRHINSFNKHLLINSDFRHSNHETTDNSTNTLTCVKEQDHVMNNSKNKKQFSKASSVGSNFSAHQHSVESDGESRSQWEHSHRSQTVSHVSESDRSKKYSKFFRRNCASVGIQVSQPVSVLQKCPFCHKAIGSHSNNCTQKEEFKAVLNQTLENRLGLLKTKRGKSGSSFCVFSSGCFCCCNKTLQEAFNFHRSELVQRIEARKNDVIKKSKKTFFLTFPLNPPTSQKLQTSKKKDVKTTTTKSMYEKSSSNKENKQRSRRNDLSHNTVANKQRGRQKTLNNYNRIMCKIYSQRLKSETLKGKVNYERHENLIKS